MALSTEAIIAKAKSFSGVKAGIISLEDVLNSPSYQTTPEEEWSISTRLSNNRTVTEWPANAKSVLVLGLHHPEDKPQLDWCKNRNTTGNRMLMKIAQVFQQWCTNELGLDAIPLPYFTENGGLFLKDAAVLAGLGIIGKNNLLINPEWGPRIRLRSILIEGELKSTEPLQGFSPCKSCGRACRLACPQKAFSTGNYYRTSCISQMKKDIAGATPDGDKEEDGNASLIIKYCRCCEFACPVGRED